MGTREINKWMLLKVNADQNGRGPSRRSQAHSWVYLGLLLIGLTGPLTTHATPDGTRSLGHQHGLLSTGLVHIDLNAGETLRLCSSDDGSNDRDPVHESCLGSPEACDQTPGQRFRIDAADVQDNLVDVGRRGAEIILRPPNPISCVRATDCPGDDLTCHAANGDPILDAQDGVSGYCVFSFAVESIPSAMGSVRGPQPGFCTSFHNPDDRQWHDFAVPQSGTWVIDFAGEKPTLIGPTQDGLFTDKSSTRFFEVDVLEVDGTQTEAPRIYALNWELTHHSSHHNASSSFYALVGSSTYQLELNAARAMPLNIQVTSLGIPTSEHESRCLFDPQFPQQCSVGLGQQTPRRLPGEFPVFISNPSGQVRPERPPEISQLVFGDALGSNSLSPNGDGNQDAGRFTFAQILRAPSG